MKLIFSHRLIFPLLALILLNSCATPIPTAIPTQLPTDNNTATAQPAATIPPLTPTTADATPPPFPGVKVAQSSAARIMAPNAPEADIRALTAGNSAFAIDLYHKLTETKENLFFSPHSISIALAMTYAGARGKTATDMAQTLHFTLPAEQLHPAFNALDLTLQPGQAYPEEQPLELHTANSLWAQYDETFRAEFLDLLAQNYGAGLQLVDYVHETEPARQAINQWVSNQTKERIQNLVPQGAVTPDTRLVLVNAIYFKGGWLYPFNEQATADAPFTRLDQSQVNVPLMKWVEAQEVNYSRDVNYQAVELPYQGGNAVLTLLVPDEGQFTTFEQGLTAEQLTNVLNGMVYEKVLLSMPRFHNESDFDLTETLGKMGMGEAMGSSADFSGMTGAPGLFISRIVHKSFVDVDEKGTEAAAATAVIMNKGMAPSPKQPVELKVDRPFIYLIRDTRTGEVLFMGRVLDPGQ